MDYSLQIGKELLTHRGCFKRERRPCLAKEENVIGHNGGSQVGVQALRHLQHVIKLRVVVLCDHLQVPAQSHTSDKSGQITQKRELGTLSVVQVQVGHPKPARAHCVVASASIQQIPCGVIETSACHKKELREKLAKDPVSGGDLDGAKNLGSDQSEVLGLQDLGEGDKDGGGRDRAVLLGDGVALQPVPSKGQRGPWDLFQLLHVAQHGLSAP
jgi:hypothetical protein